MRKVFVIALREYNAAVRTKAFILGLLMMPLLMGGSIIGQSLMKNYRDVTPRRFAVLDRTPNAVLLPSLQEAVEGYNAKLLDAKTGQQKGPPFELEVIEPKDDLETLRQSLSDRARRGKLDGILEIGPACVRLALPKDPAEAAIVFRASKITEREFPALAQAALATTIQQLRCQEAKLPAQDVAQVIRPVSIDSRGLLLKDNGRQSESNQIAAVLAPAMLVMLMFMLILMSAMPLMQGVVEEKMQRIAEVLLASVSPFQLMLGKLLGVTAVSMTIATIYLGGAYWAAHRYGMAEFATPSIVVWFIVFQALAALMYGSLFIAVGAACTDMRETQNLLWPVMLLATMPIFILANVLREPNSAVVTGMSFFPFATPTLMIARLAIPPGVAWWQPLVGVMGMVAMTLACVWMAGRIFRVGILMMGKGASPMEMARWVWRG